MRIILNILTLLLLQSLAVCQGTPPMDPEQLAKPTLPSAEGSPPMPPQASSVQEITRHVKKELEQAILGRTYPSREQWEPLSPSEKFQVFVHHSYAPRTFASAAVDSVKYKIGGDNPEYEKGMLGFGQHYGIELATSESDIFMERFLVPTLLKQDPRYFRAPGLPFFKRVMYSVSRVVITRADNGSQTFNASRVLGGAASQAISDLYVPGQRQGLRPVANRVTFDLARDAGFNLLHEFWPDLRRKLFHR
jgi:hypothetical protein